MKNPERAGTFLKLERSIQHVNLPHNEEVFVSSYLSPATIRRISQSSKASTGDIESVGIEVLVGGRQVEGGVKTTKEFGRRPDWWNISSDKVISSNNYKLLNKNETPYKNLWWDRYVEVDPEAK